MISRISITPHPSKPLVWWNRQRDLIDMNPPYQRRGRLWSPSDKAYLVDSIINGFDVPKIYMANFQLGDSNLNVSRKPYAIIDGKQRFEAVFDFFDGMAVLNKDFIWTEDPSLKLGGLGLRDLRGRYPSVAEAFETESLDIMNVVAANEEQINELFVRLNRSKPLTGAEIRNAMVGPVSDISRNIARHPFFTENIKFGVKRAADYNAAAKLLLFEFTGAVQGTKKSDLDEFAMLQTSSESIELAGRRVIDNLDVIQEVFLPKDELLGSAGIIPVYYWFIRNSKASYRIFVREFLLQFEHERRMSREMQKRADSIVDPEMARYDTLNRSTNDLGSHRGRYEILVSRFVEFVRSI